MGLVPPFRAEILLEAAVVSKTGGGETVLCEKREEQSCSGPPSRTQCIAMLCVSERGEAVTWERLSLDGITDALTSPFSPQVREEKEKLSSVQFHRTLERCRESSCAKMNLPSDSFSTASILTHVSYETGLQAVKLSCHSSSHRLCQEDVSL